MSSNEWSEKHLEECRKLGIPPNLHPSINHKKPTPYPEGQEIAGKLRKKAEAPPAAEAALDAPTKKRAKK
jgi:hypothetical protein